MSIAIVVGRAYARVHTGALLVVMMLAALVSGCSMYATGRGVHRTADGYNRVFPRVSVLY